MFTVNVKRMKAEFLLKSSNCFNCSSTPYNSLNVTMLLLKAPKVGTVKTDEEAIHK